MRLKKVEMSSLSKWRHKHGIEVLFIFWVDLLLQAGTDLPLLKLSAWSLHCFTSFSLTSLTSTEQAKWDWTIPRSREPPKTLPCSHADDVFDVEVVQRCHIRVMTLFSLQYQLLQDAIYQLPVLRLLVCMEEESWSGEGGATRGGGVWRRLLTGQL